MMRKRKTFAVLYCIKSTYKWTHAIQTCIVRGSTTYSDLPYLKKLFCIFLSILNLFLPSVSYSPSLWD